MPTVAVFIDQGLDQQRLDGIPCRPVLFQPTQCIGQDQAGQIGDVNPGQDQEPALVDDLLQVLPPGRLVPADPLIPC